ncbi:von Willebrand factor A domain-containing protein 3B isoform X2 [Hyla sarda]|uniref:von Willebrand factor A domain-containing protein 3B isoform X2 n=1 Tax=Hyla sarda TaxID=327740 RepID=UPI0024C27C3F|nr:von Willebrand factor A domain-containing protein 3B isoform X2 [Hyla sarda]
MEETAQASSSGWLQSFGLRKKKLTMPKILARLGFQQKEDYVNKLGRPVSSRYSHGLFRQYTSNGKIYNLTAKKEEVLQKVESITNIIDLYKQRLVWLNSSSRSVFGVVQEQSVVIILDLNASNKEQHSLCLDAICLVIREQIAHISKFNLIWVSQEPVKWHQKIIRITQHSIEEAVEWIQTLQQSPVTNVDSAAEAVSEALDDQMEAIYYFSVGDMSAAKIQKLKQSIENIPYPLHVVCYNPHKTKTITLLNELSRHTSGRFHVYFEKYKEEKDMKTNQSNGYPDMPEPLKDLPELDVKKDELLIKKELSEAQENLKQLQDIWKTFYHLEDEKDSTVMVEETSEDCVSSKEWLKKFGLKTQKLLFYDALADCAFRHSDGVVDIKTKPEDESIQTDAENNMKLINAKYCDRFVHVLWKDGSVAHVHISKEKCRWYEEKMRTALDRMNRRVKWLQNGSRELFGTILEDQVYVLIDTSHSMKDKLFLVREKILQLLQEQLKHKRMFNFVKFDSRVEAWKPKLAEVSEDYIKEAWCWIKELQVGSSTNTLKALEVALTDSNTQAVYLLTDGRPDQPTDTIIDQVNVLNRIPIHTISFNCDDTEANSFLYKLSGKTGGRYHTYSSYLLDPDAPKPFVSEDIQLLLNEIEEGKSTLEKVKKLHTDCLMLDWCHNGGTDLSQRLQSAHELRSSSSLLHRSSLSPPRLLQRKKTRHAEHTRASLLRALSHGVRLSGNVVDLHIPSETKELFLNMDRKTASVLKEMNLLEGSKVQSKVKKVPKNSLDISSSRWLKTYGLVPRRLTIMDALAPTTVTHSAKYIPILDKHVVSKVFDEVLPLAHISGNRKRITLINPQAVNLSDYKERIQQAIQSYGRRLNLIVWRALSQEERDNFNSDVPISYLDNKEALLQALDRLGWPISAEDVMLLEDELQAGKTYLQQALDLEEITSKKSLAENSDIQKYHEGHEKQKHKSKKKFLDTLRSQKVIARSEIDGFYYPGTVVKSINSRTALVDFWLGENVVVPIRFIIQTGGALPCPTLKVGDCVFSKTGAKGGGGGCYVPAVVIATPRTDAADKLYTVLKYDKRKEHCLRCELIKITPSQFAVSCGYIRKAQMIDFTIPSVQLAKPLMMPTPPKKEKKAAPVSRRSRRSVIHIEPRTPSDSDSLASTDSTDQERNLLHENILNKLEDLASQVTQYQNEQKENKKAIQEYIRELKEHHSHQDTSDLQEEAKHTTKKKINLLEQLKWLIPIRNTEKEKNESPVDSPLLPGQKVLSICSHNGWYEEGSVIHDCGDLTYFVEKPSGEVSKIHRYDLLTDADDVKKEIKENDPVIGPHPLHPGSYCPGVVLNCTPDLNVTVRYYDSTEDFVPREHIYSISPEKYKRDTSYILACVERWVGQPVVARNDETGTFHLAEVKKQTDNHKKYVISWADGTTAIQDMEWIFGKFSQPHVLNVGDHVLALAYPSSLTFLPGIISAINGIKLQIVFCNGKRCQDMEAHHCFGLSEKTYDSAVQLYYKNNQTVDSDEDHISSENEDSLSDISSFTVSSVESGRRSVRGL